MFPETSCSPTVIAIRKASCIVGGFLSRDDPGIASPTRLASRLEIFLHNSPLEHLRDRVVVTRPKPAALSLACQQLRSAIHQYMTKSDDSSYVVNRHMLPPVKASPRRARRKLRTDKWRIADDEFRVGHSGRAHSGRFPCHRI